MNCFNFKDVWFNEDRIDRFKRTKNNSLIVIQGRTHEEFHCVGEQTIEELENEFLRAMEVKDKQLLSSNVQPRQISSKDADRMVERMAASVLQPIPSNEEKATLQAKATKASDFAFNEVPADKVKKGKTLKTDEDVKEV